AQDYDETFPTVGDLPKTNPDGTVCDTDTRKPNGRDIVRMMGGGLQYMLNPYIKNAGIFKCPSDTGENYWGRSTLDWPWSTCFWFQSPTSYHFRHIFDIGGGGHWGDAHNQQLWVGTKLAQIGRPASLMPSYEAAALHIEKLPL